MRITLLSKLTIPLLIHQRLHLPRIAQLNPRQPPLRLRARIDNPRLLLERIIRLHNLARDGRHDVGGGFDGLDGADGVALADFEVEGGELDEDDVAEGFGCVG